MRTLIDTISTDGQVAEEPELGGEISEDELTALALAAEPNPPLADDAVPLSVRIADGSAPLPTWYMPAAAMRVDRGWRKWRTVIVITVVFAFLLIEALGLCNTYGQLGLG